MSEYCEFCGSKDCKSSGLECIMSPKTLDVLIPFLMQNYFNNSVFNKSYSFVPFESWDSWANENDLPTQDALLALYPEEDLESLLYMALDGASLPPELESYYHDPMSTDEHEASLFSEFSTPVAFETKGGVNLTREWLMRYNKRRLEKIPNPRYVTEIILEYSRKD